MDVSKQVYKFQEALTCLALRASGIPNDRVHWPVKSRPIGLSVDVDVLVGASISKPDLNISVKHAAKANHGNATDKAFWRMIREFCETKSRLGSKVLFYNVFFDAGIKPNLNTILLKVFDGYLVVDEQSYGSDLIEICYQYTKTKFRNKGDLECLECLSDAIDKHSDNFNQDLAKVFLPFTRDINDMVSGKNNQLSSLWGKVSRDFKRVGTTGFSCNSSLKKGAAKFAIFPQPLREAVYSSVEDGFRLDCKVPYSFELLNLVEKDISDSYVCDPSILWLLENFSKCEIEHIYATSPMGELKRKYLNPLRNVINFESFLAYVCDDFYRLTDWKYFRSRMKKCYVNPMSLLESYQTEGDESTLWLFNTVLAVIKATGETKDVGGLRWLAEETGVKRLTSTGFYLAPFVFREKTIPDADLDAICRVLSAQLGKTTKQEIERTSTKLRDEYVRKLMEWQLVPTKLLDPIGALLKRELDRSNKKWKVEKTMPTCFKEIGGVTKGATCKVLLIESTHPSIILWQSPNKNARDKAKEFGAKVVGLKWKWEELSEEFVYRGYKVFMIVDGVWAMEDVEGLIKMGCEEVYRVTEISNLVNRL